MENWGADGLGRSPLPAPEVPKVPRVPSWGGGCRGWGVPGCPPTTTTPPRGVPRSITRSFYRSAAGVLLVFDLTNRASFERVPEWHREAAGDRPPAFVLVGHKCDLVAQRAVSAEEAGHLAASLGMVAFVETSARGNLNVELAFQTLAGGIQQALGRGGVTPHRGCGGIRLIPSRSRPRPPARGEPRQRCQC
ncbi:LOW QUALITY PROTEIN: ras-related protein Rab-42-like [Rissa tridactyla]|uniref:LOW QUALITY PROTEIN: ras-related protein Rab-42-like n=1 Tax=Rissa tridactyla TaxID=75485 RepID=UPI0023BB01C1|nr:LOW QUALITY PROTEIN: ras-related protein Rab-42-like [Rissa tridactyla]